MFEQFASNDPATIRRQHGSLFSLFLWQQFVSQSGSHTVGLFADLPSICLLARLFVCLCGLMAAAAAAAAWIIFDVRI